MKNLRRTLTIFAFDFPPSDGGVSRLCSEIARSFAQRRKDVVLVITQYRTGSEKVNGAYRVISVTSKRPRRELSAFVELLQIRNRSSVICSVWYPDGLIATLAGVKTRIILAHGSELMPKRSFWRRYLWKEMQKRILRSADLVVANSEFTKQMVISADPSSSCVALPLAVDHRRFRPLDRRDAKRNFGQEDKFVISTVARLYEYKGHEVVFRMLALLPEHLRAKCVYLIAGKGPDKALLQEKSRAQGVSDMVVWLGYVPEHDLADLYCATDIFVLCTRESPEQSHVEGFGLVLLEAQACGTPVVATSTGGVPNAVVDGEGGWLINEDDAEKLASIVQSALEAPGLLRHAGSLARNRIMRDCTWDQYTDQLIQICAERGISLE